MAVGYEYDLETLALLEAKKVKKKGEAATALLTPAEAEGGGPKKFFRLAYFVVEVSAETIVYLLDGGTVFWQSRSAAKTPLQVTLPRSGYLSKGKGNKLEVSVLAEVEVTGTWMGREE